MVIFCQNVIYIQGVTSLWDRFLVCWKYNKILSPFDGLLLFGGRSVILLFALLLVDTVRHDDEEDEDDDGHDDPNSSSHLEPDYSRTTTKSSVYLQ